MLIKKKVNYLSCIEGKGVPFYANQIINPFLISIISANYEKEDEFQTGEILIQKRFYNRDTNSLTFCVIQQMSPEPPFPSVQLK